MKYIVFIGILYICLSCGKKKSCFKSVGGSSTLEYVFNQDIDSLFLNDNIKYTLIPSSNPRIQLIGGENYIALVDVVFGDKKLIVTDGNKCDFLHSYDKIGMEAKIYVDSITYIEYKGSNSLKSNDTLASNELRVAMREGVGDVDLIVSNSYLSAYNSYGFGNYTIRGKTQEAFLSCASHSYCNTSDLKVANKLVVHSNTIGNMIINANGVDLVAKILGRGNILYTGNPTSISLDKIGIGELIKSD